MMKYVDRAHSQYLNHLTTSKENQTIAGKKKLEAKHQKKQRSKTKMHWIIAEKSCWILFLGFPSGRET